MYSILWAQQIGGCIEIQQLGPFRAEEKALMAAIAAQLDGEFDIEKDNVYLMGTSHYLEPLNSRDLIIEEEK